MTNLSKRLIPVLLVKGNKLVKTKKFSKGIYLGDPLNTIAIFNEKEVDELVVLDISASKEKRGPNLELVRAIYDECFMPLAYGGGIQTLDDIENVFEIGVEKVIINSAKSRPGLIEGAVKRYGSQSIVAAIDVTSFRDTQVCFDHLSGTKKYLDPIVVAKKMVGRGVGELLITDVDRDGTRLGYNCSWLRGMSACVDVPVVACGGAAYYSDLYQLLKSTEVSAAAAGSVFTLYGEHDAPLVMYPSRNDIIEALGDENY